MINNLATYRRKAKLTQKEFSEKLEVSTVSISKWENPNFDLRDLPVKTIEHICEVLNISFWDLLKI